MGAEQSAPLTVEVKFEVDGSTITLKEVTTSEACKDDCECNWRRRNAKSRKSRRARARARASKIGTSNEASEVSHHFDGSKSNGNSSKQSSDGNNCNGSKYNGNSSTSSSSYVGSRGTGVAGRSGRRETDDSGNGEMEVITLEDSSDGETASELEEEAQLIRLIQKRIGRK